MESHLKISSRSEYHAPSQGAGLIEASKDSDKLRASPWEG